MNVKKDHYVYILQCGDHSFYTGYTTDIKRRLAQHQEGKASKYTRSRLPVRLIYYEKGDSKSWGLKRELEIKKLNRKQKEMLIKEGLINEYPEKL
ncbi:MAG: GIY-YIG nuclease family protein [Tepidibacillus sp.]|uniref:GIY-YIG nuclease family protein n=1 Tax=Tepidibacillus sp. HK-1 TaxID=1883407 RepID=UPI000852D2C4|nr:GIY-YIG nuclease family protein [Tepidibacillus sp. HK-1]GBF11418.1 GIY-YIG nuclease superfamily protein [Tepidibacillus sp. HK-1]